MSISKKISLFSCCLIIILLVAFAATPPPPLIIAQPSSSHVTLKHVDHGKGLTEIELLQRSLERGKKRISAFEAATQFAHGAYLVNFSIGTPTPSPITAILETAAEFTWIQCIPCRPCFNQSTDIFDPRKSHSYSKLKCSTKPCQMMSDTCSGKYCSYDYQYIDNSTSHGIIASDTFTFEGSLKTVIVPNLLFGCGFKDTGNWLGGSGIFALGRGKRSIVYQMNEPKFSYCLPAHHSDEAGFLKMGEDDMSTTATTPLIINPNSRYEVYYYISLQGITIRPTRLKMIDNSTFAIREDGSGGMIIDSGTTVTYLRQTAFDQVENEVTRQLIGLKKINGSDIGLDLCFEDTTRQLLEKKKKKKNRIYKLPAFVLHFENGVDLNLTQNNTYKFFTNSDDPKKRYVCLMMDATLDSGISILGNYQQQNTLVTYDLSQQKLSFLPNCGQL